MNWQNKEDEIKRIIDSREFEYDEGDWMAAQKLMAGKKRKRRFLLWFTSSLVITAGLLTWWAFPSAQQTQAKNNIATYNVNNERGNSAGSNTSNTNNTAQSEETAHSSTDNSKTINDNAATINGQTVTTQPANGNGGGTTAATTGTQTTNGTQSGDENTLPANQKPLQNNNTQPEQSGQGGTTTADNGNTKTEQQNTTPANAENTGNNGDVDDAGNNKFSTPAQTDTGTDVVPENPVTKTDDPAKTNNDGPKTTKEKDADKANTDKDNKQVLAKHTLSAIVGGNYSWLYRAHNGNAINSPYFGALYNYRHNDYWQFAGGLGYTSLNANGLKKEFKGREHSFGIEEKEITITTDKLHYIELPLFAKYSPKPFFSLMAGLNMGYLLNTNNTFSQSGYTTLGGTQPLQQQSSSMYMKGINRWDMQLQLGAEVRLKDYLYIGVLANGGLFDVGMNNYYNNTVYERNTRLQLYIRYNVFTFKK